MTAVHVDGRQARGPRLPRQTRDGVHRLGVVFVGQLAKLDEISFQFVVAQRARTPLVVQHPPFFPLVVHELRQHVAPAVRLAVVDDVAGHVHHLQALPESNRTANKRRDSRVKQIMKRLLAIFWWLAAGRGRIRWPRRRTRCRRVCTSSRTRTVRRTNRRPGNCTA